MTSPVISDGGETGSTRMISSQWLPALAILFVGSGCAALIYEVVWLQLLQLEIGASAVSMGVLLGTFMGGMCLGSLLFPRFISSSHHPLRVFALLELGIGLLGLLEVWLVPMVSDLYVHFATTGLASLLLRGLFAGICLLPPTILMGATLPAIARWVETTRDGVAWLGFFYGINIAGAVLGTLLAGWYLLRLYDMQTASLVAAAINGSVAALGFVLSIVAEHHPEQAQQDEATERLADVGADAWMIYGVIALSGLTGLGAQVTWTRLLSLMLGANVYTFANTLAIFLTGLGMGSTVGTLVASGTARPRQMLGWCQVMLAVTIGWAGYATTFMLPFWPIDPRIAASTPWSMFQVDLARTCWVVLPASMLWGASFPLALAGVARRGQDPGKLVGSVSAANTLGAIAGALLFSLVIMPALGSQGAQRLLIVLSMASALLASGSLLARRREAAPPASRTVGPIIGMVATVMLAVGLVATVSQPNWVAVAFGRHAASWIPISYPGILTDDEMQGIKQVNAMGYRLELHGDSFTTQRFDAESDRWEEVADATLDVEDRTWLTTNRPTLVSALAKGERMRPALAGDEASSRAYRGVQIRGRADGRTFMLDMPGGAAPDRFCTFVGEGTNVSVAVTHDTAGYRYFHGAGKVQASSDPADMHLQRMLGHLAALTSRRRDDVLVIACGAGVTAGSFVPYDDVKHITICDIEPMVPAQIAAMFAKENHNVVTDPRTRFVIDDGRHFIRTTKQKFDIITSDPIDPWVKGCAALNTVEYYQLCKDRLKPGGVMAIWIPLYESSEETSMSVIATFFKVFPNGILWSNDSSGQGYDAVLFGTTDEPKIDIDGIQASIDANPKVKESLHDAHIGTAGNEAIELLATYAGNAEHLDAWSRNRPDLINYDRNLRLQYVAGLWTNQEKAPELFKTILRYYKYPQGLFDGKADADGVKPSVLMLEATLIQRGRIEH
jgi:spermidine synthase